LTVRDIFAFCIYLYVCNSLFFVFFFSSRRRHTRFSRDWSSDVCSSDLEPDRCEDPHVERLLEGFAFLAARIHLKVDDEFPEVTQGLLNTLYPHYVRPIPCMTVVEMFVDPEQGKQSAGMTVPRDTLLYSRRVNNMACKFQTCYDTTL